MRVEARRKAGRDGDDVLTVTVTDNGAGLPGGKLPAGRTIAGSGLGTQIVQSLVQDLRGKITWSTPPEGGTAVKFTARLRRLPSG